jgi:hypothetical protein
LHRSLKRYTIIGKRLALTSASTSSRLSLFEQHTRHARIHFKPQISFICVSFPLLPNLPGKHLPVPARKSKRQDRLNSIAAAAAAAAAARETRKTLQLTYLRPKAILFIKEGNSDH